MKNYRIRSELSVEKLESGYFLETKPVYHVERRFLWLWWIKEIYPSTFTTYEEALYHVRIVRKGNLMFDI